MLEYRNTHTSLRKELAQIQVQIRHNSRTEHVQSPRVRPNNA